MSANFGFLDTEITDVTGIDFDQGQGDFQKGHELPLSPEFTGNLALSRNFELGGSRLNLRADYRYQSSSKVKFSPQVPIDEYTSRSEVNARAGFTFGAGRRLRSRCVWLQPDLREVLRGDPGPAWCLGLVSELCAERGGVALGYPGQRAVLSSHLSGW